MRKLNYYRTILGSFIFIIVLIVIVLLRNEGSKQTYQNISKIPEFITTDIRGLEIKKSDFNGKNLFVQFIDPRQELDLKLIKDICSKWKYEDLAIAIFSNDVESFKIKSGIELQDFFVIENSYEEMKSIFKSPRDVGTYYLFDKKGFLISSGKNDVGYEDGPKILLKQLVKNEYFDISNIIPEHVNINSIDWFQAINKQLSKRKGSYNIIALFSSICNSCDSGTIIYVLNELFNNNENSLSVLGVLNNKLGIKDIKSLRSQLKIRFPFMLADPKLSAKWNSQISEFIESDLNNIVIVTDKSGKILRILHKNCNCWKSFYQFVSSLPKFGENT